MCGICAITSPEGSSFPIAKALEMIKHRGPDDDGVFISQNGDCHLGHVRLSIIDLTSAGHQPMEDSSERFVISYNGEVYNYLLLKKTLEETHGPINWRSTTDTEVIVEGFAREGMDFLSRMNGIFSLAIYDKVKRNLFVLRDPIGIKPLYYTEQNGAFFFCSELKGFSVFSNLRRTVRKKSMVDQLAFMYVPEPHTMYEEFVKVEPGVCSVFREGRRINSIDLFNHIYDSMSFSGEEEIVERFYKAFSGAVKRQLIADVPISLFLSGGIDSSAVAYEVVNSGANVRDAYTISVSSSDKRYDSQSDDFYYARIVAKQLGLSLKVIEARQDFMSLLPSLVGFLEDGISDPAAINTFLICKDARDDGVKVMLSGQGADEFMAGYRRYLAEKRLRSIPSVFGKVFSLFADCLPASVPGSLNAKIRRIKKFSTAASLSEHERMLSLYIWNNPQRIIDLFKASDGLAVGETLSTMFERYKNLDPILAMMLVDQKSDLLSLNLSYTDKMSMIVGVEARVPFLDFDLVKVMQSIPTDVKIKGNVQKYPLKKAMEPFLPRNIVYRQKAGFALPIRSWLRDENEMIRQYFDPDRIRRQGIFNWEALRAMCDEQFSGKADHTNTLFSMLCLQIWADYNGTLQ